MIRPAGSQLLQPAFLGGTDRPLGGGTRVSDTVGVQQPPSAPFSPNVTSKSQNWGESEPVCSQPEGQLEFQVTKESMVLSIDAHVSASKDTRPYMTSPTVAKGTQQDGDVDSATEKPLIHSTRGSLSCGLQIGAGPPQGWVGGPPPLSWALSWEA